MEFYLTALSLYYFCAQPTLGHYCSQHEEICFNTHFIGIDWQRYQQLQNARNMSSLRIYGSSFWGQCLDGTHRKLGKP